MQSFWNVPDMLQACVHCQWAGLPRRQVCPRCEDTTWVALATARGRITACALVTRNLGTSIDPGELLLTVALDQGGLIIARANSGQQFEVGDAVTVDGTLRATTD
jgi:uncharacterized OB-fold protein